MSAASSSSSSSTISRGPLRAQRRERVLGVGVLGQLGQRLAGELGRERLHHRQPLVLVQRGEDVGQVGRLEVVRPARRRRDLAVPDEIHHPLDVDRATRSWRPPGSRDDAGGGAASG